MATGTDPVKVLDTDWVTLWHGRAEDVMVGVGTESVDLVLTDPPYGVEFESKMRAESFGGIEGDGSDQNSRDLAGEILEDCVRVVGQNRHLYVFGPEVLRARDAKVSAPAQLIWDKGTVSMGDLRAPWGPAHELIHFYTSMHRHAGKRGQEKLPVRLRKGSVLKGSKRTGRTVRHPSEKPLELLCEMVESSTRRGETVFDPFAGVGSTGVAALLCGRKAVLVECKEEYVKIAAERLANAERFIVAAMTL